MFYTIVWLDDVKCSVDFDRILLQFAVDFAVVTSWVPTTHRELNDTATNQTPVMLLNVFKLFFKSAGIHPVTFSHLLLYI